MGITEDLAACVGFQGDDGNSEKNLEKHDVADHECEQVFFNEPLLVAEDDDHSAEDEPRGFVLGVTNAGRRLFVVFTVRERLVRVISARDMTTREIRAYER